MFFAFTLKEIKGQIDKNGQIADSLPLDIEYSIFDTQ
jgi:hypothetical protein